MYYNQIKTWTVLRETKNIIYCDYYNVIASKYVKVIANLKIYIII